MPGSDPDPTSNGRLDREAPLTISGQISLTPIALRRAAFAAAEFVSERARPLTWIKGVGGQRVTIRRAITYAMPGMLLTVFRTSPCS